MAVYSTAGTTISISDTEQPDTLEQTAYEGLTWTEINDHETIGTFGDSAAEVTFTALTDARVRKIKGPRDAGTTDLVMGINYEDAGQQAILAAEKSIYDYAFKIEFNDAPPGGTASVRYFRAKVMSANEELGAADNVMKLNASLGINSEIVRVNAAAA